MIEILEKENCCGCSNCMNVCPTHCISMAYEDGFIFPKVNKEKCIGCGLCEKKCPMLTKGTNNPIKSIIIARTKNADDLKNATSGGVATCFAKQFFLNGGTVVGVKLDNNNIARHVVADSIKCIYDFMGSKYVQSDMDTVVNEIRKITNSGGKVLFIGTPCQAAAVNRIVENKNNLYLIDFVCRAVASPVVFRDYLFEKEKHYESKVINVNFREKAYGYHNSVMAVYFENGKVYRKSGRIDEFHKLFFDGLSIRKSCENCSFRELERCSDLTLFEAWNAEKYTLNDDNRGFSSIAIRTEKGLELITGIQHEISQYKADMDFSLKNDGFYMNHQIPVNKNRDYFFEFYRKNGFQKANKFYLNISLVDRMFEITKPILYKTGLLFRLKKIKAYYLRCRKGE